MTEEAGFNLPNNNSGDEEQHREPEWVAVPPDTDVYLEAVETAKDP